ncbi:bifunctional isocitrate dehydrogenase kinase/phosphatase [bacterium SCN 62-11]|nr:bifunctional isocitrate dehydrogenase kinase/phosphatase [Candidatus Eremiobacteraeota bacterium]ODT66409.1 MAG: bifunctional isocitrate dehydrogenase kinase/phosphatase [bacterium SCN 62-11]
MQPAAPHITDSRLAALCSEQVKQAFLEYQTEFREISRRARQRFLERDWQGSFADASQRLHLYSEQLNDLTGALQTMMGKRFEERQVWVAIKAVYSSLIAQNPEWEIAESFFNSVTRRIFATEGVDQSIEFVDPDFDSPPTSIAYELLRRRSGKSLKGLLTEALTDSQSGGFDASLWECLEQQVEDAAERVLQALGASDEYGLEMISTAFFRGRGVYLVGRVERDGVQLPLALCLRHESERGISLDAVLVDELALSILFSYTRSYFRVDLECPYELVRQLRALLPKKPLGDLYNAIGYHRHGKTELYRDFVGHLRQSNQKFVAAEGTRGMVMLVFTLPSYDVVFKLIKDRFDYPKEASRSDVEQRYRLVFEHDRAGRLVEAHEFEHLRIPKSLFEEDLLATLLRDTAETVRLEDNDVLIAHAYVERRVRPLNLFLNEADEGAALAAALDYGQALKDLARSNIFAGDLLTKNFGVTRTGRVVFYDYDELCFITDCNFRDLPQPTTPEQEMAAEPWYSVRENDIFPEEFKRFLAFPDSARTAFYEEHGDLFDAEFWRKIQAKLRAGEIPEVFPYKAARRLPKH